MNKNKPLVSIIIPSYNRPDLLARAMRSALVQSYRNVEIIVVDDHSDYSLQDLKKEFPGVQFYQNDVNRGPCYSRNFGLRKAHGEFINFLDDDDELYPTKIERQVEKFLNSNDPKLGMITAHALDKRSGHEVVKRNSVSGNMYRKLLSSYAISGTETMLFKKACLLDINGFDENLQSSQEYDLLIRFAEKFNVDFVDEVLSQENRSTGQISLNFDKKIQGARYLFNKHDGRYRSLGLLFWLRMRVKLHLLILRFRIGKWFGESAYRTAGG